jgi:hypothetical protein
LEATRLESHGGVKMPELPSVVEEEYGRLIEGNHKKSKRRKRNRRPDFVEEHGSRETVAKAEVDTRGDRQARTTTTTSLNSRTCVPPRLENSSKSITLQDDDKTKSWYWMSYKRPMRYGVPQEGDMKAEIARRKLFHATEEGKAYKTSDDDYTTIIESFETHHLWTGRHLLRLSLETLAYFLIKSALTL